MVSLTGWLRTRQVPLEDGWAIWNRSRRLLVVRAAMLDQWRVAGLCGVDEQTRLIRVRLEWFLVFSLTGGD